MAIFSHSAIISEISGKLGANVYARNRYGPFVRVNTPPTNPDTLVQQDWRARFTAATQLWKTLTEAKRKEYRLQAENYNTRTRLGRKGKTNGFLLFVRQQILASKVSAAGNTDLTPPKMSGRYSIDAVDLSTQRFLVTITNNTAIASTYFTLMATAPLSAGIFSLNNSVLRVIIESDQIAVGTHVYDFTAQYVALYGAIDPAQGKKVFIALQSFNYLSGERGRNYFLDDIVTDSSPRIKQVVYQSHGSVSGGGTFNVAFTAPVDAGNYLVAAVCCAQTRSFTVPTGFATLQGPGGALIPITSSFKIATGSEPANYQVTNTSGSSGGFQSMLFELVNVSGHTLLPITSGATNTNSINVSTSDYNVNGDSIVISFMNKANTQGVTVTNDYIKEVGSGSFLAIHRTYNVATASQNSNYSWSTAVNSKVRSAVFF